MEQKIEIRDHREGRYYWIGNEIYEKFGEKIGAIGIALYNAYAYHARQKGQAWAGMKYIAKKLKITDRTIINYNKKLEENGLIEIQKKCGYVNLIILLKTGGV